LSRLRPSASIVRVAMSVRRARLNARGLRLVSWGVLGGWLIPA
jgi:hypothetical protein